MKYLKIFEEFNEFQLDEISEDEYRNLTPKQGGKIDQSKLKTLKLKLTTINFWKKSLQTFIQSTNSKIKKTRRLSLEYECDYGDSWVTIVAIESENDGDIILRYFIDKCDLGDDEPYYKLLYQIEKTDSSWPNSKNNSENYYFYYLFEESDFDKICENPQILIDYLEKKSTT
jgi:hypothetical protein